MRKALSSAVLLLLATTCSAFHLKVQGVVTDHLSREPLEGVLVRIYKDGKKIAAETTGPGGRYAAVLENHHEYVVRFSGSGLATKSFTVDTHGMEWVGEDGQKTLTVEMTMVEQLNGVDLSVFDLPMGRARFEPATGLTTWDTEYDRNIRGQVEEAMGLWWRRMHETAALDEAVRRD